MPRNIRKGAIGMVVHGSEEVLLGKKDAQRSQAQYGSPLRWLFFGGKINRGESTRCAFRRELGEEIGLAPCMESLEKVAIVLVRKQIPNGECKFLRIHVFLAHKATGLPHRTGEIESWRWCNQHALPHYAMLAADPHWMPLIFSGKKIIVHAVVDKNQRYLLKKVLIREVKSFPDD